MRISLVIPIIVTVFVTVQAYTTTQRNCSAIMNRCISRGTTTRQVCGDDNQTYQSRCHLDKLRCQGHPIAFLHKGPCSDKPDAKRRADRGRRNKKGCSKIDRILFVSNLLTVFRSEYERTGGSSTAAKDLVLDWKFNQVNIDQNSVLDKTEYKELRRLISKAVMPRRCARSFGRMCDSNRDETITRKEWGLCLTVTTVTAKPAPGNSHRNPQENPRLPNGSKGNKTRAPPKLVEEEEAGADEGGEELEDGNVQGRSVQGVLQGSTMTRVSARLLGLDDRSKDENDNNGCLSDRQVALDEQKNGNTVFYVPECTPDGRYQRVQCYRSTGYCWCVDQDFGKSIPGTPIKDQNPHCEAPSRPMKGCPEPKKATFLQNLLEFMRNEMKKSTNGTSLVGSSENSKWHASKDEQVATWAFVILDKNKNKVLEHKEWKPFRQLVMGNRTLRRCGKKLPRYCDINDDKSISITEWLNCLETQRQDTVQSEPVPSPKTITASKRKGPNPLESYLKGD